MCNAESQVSREEKSKLGAKCEMVEPATRLLLVCVLQRLEDMEEEF